MPAKRVPLGREARLRITPEAVALFQQLQAAETKDEWWSAHNRLHHVLELPPWRWPAVLGPDDQLYGHFHEPAARALHDELQRMLDEAVAARRR